MDVVVWMQLASIPATWNLYFQLTVYWTWFNAHTALHGHACIHPSGSQWVGEYLIATSFCYYTPFKQTSSPLYPQVLTFLGHFHSFKWSCGKLESSLCRKHEWPLAGIVCMLMGSNTSYINWNTKKAFSNLWARSRLFTADSGRVSHLVEHLVGASLHDTLASCALCSCVYACLFGQTIDYIS